MPEWGLATRSCKLVTGKQQQLFFLLAWLDHPRLPWGPELTLVLIFIPNFHGHDFIFQRRGPSCSCPATHTVWGPVGMIWHWSSLDQLKANGNDQLLITETWSFGLTCLGTDHVTSTGPAGPQIMGTSVWHQVRTQKWEEVSLREEPCLSPATDHSHWQVVSLVFSMIPMAVHDLSEPVLIKID
jgi:hypothetical protein